MQANVVSMPSFTVVGLKIRTQVVAGEIVKLWEDLFLRYAEIKTTRDMGGMYGVMHAYDEKTGQFDYMACVQADPNASVPKDMAAFTIPEQTYAVFATTLPMEAETYRHIENNWLPQSGFRRTYGPEFEHYNEQFEPGDPYSTLYLYIPIVKVDQSENQKATEVY